MISDVIADDHHLVRQGIRALLEKAGDIEVVGEAADGPEALALVERLLPAVLVIEEMRTPEIVSAALEAAELGLLVIGALLAHTATGVIDRIIDAYPPRASR